MAGRHVTHLREMGRKFRASISLTPQPSVTTLPASSSTGSKEPIDPANHYFDPPLPSIEKVHGCERCNLMVGLMYWRRDRIPGKDYSDDQPYILHRTREGLENGVRSRCWWCLRIETSLTRFEKERNVKEPDSGRGVFLNFWLGKSDTTYNVYVRTWRHVGLPPFTVNMFSDVKWIAEHLREPPANIGSYTGGSSTRNYVKGRLENCARTHPACQTSNPWVPTRLLEVTTMGPAIRLRVVPTGAWTEKKRYISLSHQWGANPTATPQLTKKTYDAYQDRIPMGRLPRKYIDAIQAAQQLGVQYLWIDSLVCVFAGPLHSAHR